MHEDPVSLQDVMKSTLRCKVDNSCAPKTRLALWLQRSARPKRDLKPPRLCDQQHHSHHRCLQHSCRAFLVAHWFEKWNFKLLPSLSPCVAAKHETSSLVQTRQRSRSHTNRRGNKLTHITSHARSHGRISQTNRHTRVSSKIPAKPVHTTHERAPSANIESLSVSTCGEQIKSSEATEEITRQETTGESRSARWPTSARVCKTATHVQASGFASTSMPSAQEAEDRQEDSSVCSARE